MKKKQVKPHQLAVREYSEATDNPNLSLILKELKEFKKDNSQQLNEIHARINKTNKWMEDSEERIRMTETQIQTTEVLQKRK